MSKVVTATFIFIVSLVIFVILLFLVRKNFIEQKAISFVSPIAKQEITENLSAEKDTNVLAEKSKLVVATLKSFSDSTAEGSATKSNDTENFTLSIDASLPEPQSGFYEAWLVKGRYGQADFDYFSLGKLVKVGEKYNLEFSDQKDYFEYKTVVVTKEETSDNLPETHTLEGTFPD